MTDPKLGDSLRNLGSAIERLREALAVPVDEPLTIDGTIQRFEFVIEVFWKTLKRALEYEGVATTTPREALTEAFAAGMIGDETMWLDMLRDRNQTSHVYSELMARAIYDRIRTYFPTLDSAYHGLIEKYDTDVP